MTKNLNNALILAFLLLGSLVATAQEYEAWKAPVITDEMTVDAEQNKAWREGNHKYSAKPKNMWELGLHLGHFAVNGDVPTFFPAGYGLGLHLRKALGYTVSIRGSATYFNTKGLDGRITPKRVLQLDNPTLSNSLQALNNDGAWRNFKTTGLSGSLEAIISLGNILWHRERNRWNMYLGIGMAMTAVDTKMDYFDANGNPYDLFDASIPSAGIGGSNTLERRKAIKALLDGVYESQAQNERDVPFLFDNGTLVPSFVASLAVSRKLSKRINLTLEHKVFLQDFDKWDGHEWREADTADGGGDQTNDSDQAHYTNLILGINLGSFDNRTEPLYWLNPLDPVFSNVAELKMRPELDLTDTDGDGVIDMLDQEETEPGCPVDTRGIALDSDGDGLIDCKDKEIYSPPGYEIDNDGVAIVPEGPKYLTEPEIANMINDRVRTLPTPKASMDWFLPMIHFDLDKYRIKPEFYGQLHHVATVMKQNPGLTVVAEGHTDNRMPNDYNNVLAYKRAKAAIDYLVSHYGISRDRLILRYGGEIKPMIGALPDNHNISKDKEIEHYMNRRVEFRIAQPGDTNMGRPAGPDAGKNTPHSSRPGSKYSGNRNSGY